MQKKYATKKVNTIKKERRIGLNRLIIIAIALIIALSFILFSIYTPNRNRPGDKTLVHHSNSGPSFRKDGDLIILTSQSGTKIKFDIEVVKNNEERMRGLMDRLNLPENAGMLFIFPFEEPRSFWMKDTFISLDIIYINSNMEIVSIQKYTQPKSTYSLPSEKPARYVLEVNAGISDKYGIAPGDKIEFSY